MVSKINASQYLYTPYYYVLDASAHEFEVRATLWTSRLPRT